MDRGSHRADYGVIDLFARQNVNSVEKKQCGLAPARRSHADAFTLDDLIFTPLACSSITSWQWARNASSRCSGVIRLASAISADRASFAIFDSIASSVTSPRAAEDHTLKGYSPHVTTN